MKRNWKRIVGSLLVAAGITMALAQDTDDSADIDEPPSGYDFTLIGEASGILVNQRTGKAQALVVCEYELPSAHFCLVPIPEFENYSSPSILIAAADGRM